MMIAAQIRLAPVQDRKNAHKVTQFSGVSISIPSTAPLGAANAREDEFAGKMSGDDPDAAS